MRPSITTINTINGTFTNATISNIKIISNARTISNINNDTAGNNITANNATWNNAVISKNSSSKSSSSSITNNSNVNKHNVRKLKEFVQMLTNVYPGRTIRFNTSTSPDNNVILIPNNNNNDNNATTDKTTINNTAANNTAGNIRLCRCCLYGCSFVRPLVCLLVCLPARSLVIADVNRFLFVLSALVAAD